MAPATRTHAEEILVAAAASLHDALREIGSVYAKSGKHTVRFNFGPSSGLARQIDEGAPADLFFSADLLQMEVLDKKGRLEPGTGKNVLSNQLVFIVPADSKLPWSSVKDLLRPEVKRVALAEPGSVPAGVYGRRYLEQVGLWEQIRVKIVPVQDVRAALAAVESANVDAGIVYKTDAAASKRARIVHEVPADKGPGIVYPVAVVKDSKRKQAARDFISFLDTRAARQIFEKHGFVILP